MNGHLPPIQPEGHNCLGLASLVGPAQSRKVNSGSLTMQPVTVDRARVGTSTAVRTVYDLTVS